MSHKSKSHRRRHYNEHTGFDLSMHRSAAMRSRMWARFFLFLTILLATVISLWVYWVYTH